VGKIQSCLTTHSSRRRFAARLNSGARLLDTFTTWTRLKSYRNGITQGDWEHGYGVEIGTLDNPGWRVSINLVDTDLAEQPFAEIQNLEHETDWIHCRVRDGKWEGHGGQFMLEKILWTFLAWAADRQTV
jgi:hypothetical protein